MLKTEVQPNRRENRRPVLESFQMFAVLPTMGHYRLKIYDITTLGIGFCFAPFAEFDPFHKPIVGQELPLELYLNDSLHLHLNIRVVRLVENEDKHKIGAEFIHTDNESYHAFLAFMKFVDQLEYSLQDTALQ